MPFELGRQLAGFNPHFKVGGGPKRGRSYQRFTLDEVPSNVPLVEGGPARIGLGNPGAKSGWLLEGLEVNADRPSAELKRFVQDAKKAGIGVKPRGLASRLEPRKVLRLPVSPTGHTVVFLKPKSRTPTHLAAWNSLLQGTISHLNRPGATPQAVVDTTMNYYREETAKAAKALYELRLSRGLYSNPKSELRIVKH